MSIWSLTFCAMSIWSFLLTIKCGTKIANVSNRLNKKFAPFGKIYKIVLYIITRFFRLFGNWVGVMTIWLNR